MASDPGQDWWSLIYLFLAGLVSVVVEMIRRKAEHIDDEDERRRRDPCHHPHHRDHDDCEYYHRRCEDPPEYHDEGDNDS